MPYHLTSADIAPPTPLGSTGWQRVQLPREAGCCQSDSIVLDDGLRLIYTDYRPACDVLEASTQERACAALTLTVALQGQSSTLAGGQRYDFAAGHSTLTAFASVQGLRRFPAADVYGPIRQLRLVAEAPLLHRYGLAHLTQGVRAKGSARHVLFGPCSPAVGYLAETLVHLHAGAGSVLELQIAALSLLSEQTRPLMPFAATSGPQRLRTLHMREQEKMQRARELLMQHYAQPLTLAYISRMVCTNECTLKRGFRACFGTTVYRMLTDIRMHRARELLEAGQPMLAVAQQVGYGHAGSFGTAFRRYWGK